MTAYALGFVPFSPIALCPLLRSENYNVAALGEQAIFMGAVGNSKHETPEKQQNNLKLVKHVYSGLA